MATRPPPNLPEMQKPLRPPPKPNLPEIEASPNHPHRRLVGTPPAFPIALYICFGMNLKGRGAMMSFAVMVILPSIRLNLFYAILPTYRHLHCSNCSYQHRDKKSRYLTNK